MRCEKKIEVKKNTENAGTFILEGPLALRPSHYLSPQTRPRSGIFYLQTLDPPDLRQSDLRPYVP